ncbi:MAG TPA: phosphoenolpyruvate carboxykinase (ATP), partial [Methylomirabilota bacterium]|nr:phosphoenolpyruvate carboxykinase (ATP) [Methylomirabilota bacterium]
MKAAPQRPHLGGAPGDSPERRNLSPAALYERAIRRDEAAIVSTGALTAETGRHTGRSPKDKFFVKEPTSRDAIWWHPGNQPISTSSFDGLLARMEEFSREHDVYTQDVFACADPSHRLRVRVITELAWHSLFARNLFIRPTGDELLNFEPDFTVMALPSVKADPARDGTHSETFILVNLGRHMVLIGGTEYAGEIKKSIFTALNYLLPAKGVFPMHCSANVDEDGGDEAIFFGLSGTGKTTLSADPSRRLIGDDEHGW